MTQRYVTNSNAKAGRACAPGLQRLILSGLALDGSGDGDRALFVEIEQVGPGGDVASAGCDFAAQLQEVLLAVRARRGGGLEPLSIPGLDVGGRLLVDERPDVVAYFRIALGLGDDVEQRLVIDTQEREHRRVHRPVIMVLADVAVRLSLAFVDRAGDLNEPVKLRLHTGRIRLCK